MNSTLRCGAIFALLTAVSLAAEVTLPNVTLKPAEVVNLWPGAAPGETGKLGPERILPDRPRPFDQIDNVSVPTLLVFPAAPAKRNGTGMLVIPGGGLDRLAIETEGYEVAEWLNAQGITAFVLKYRVPARSGGPRWKVGVQDAQRAMGLIRARAQDWKVDADAIGSIGFSAGAEINVMLATYHADPRQYEPVDATDQLSTRPDFNIAIYGGGFAGQQGMREDIGSRINKTTPPMFVAHAFDDAMLSSTILMTALKRANIPSELHIFAAGAHGFGVRDSGLPVGRFRDQLLGWMGWLGYLDAAPVRAYARDFVAGQKPTFAGDLGGAYAAQRRIVRATLAQGGEVAGYKAAFTTTGAQTAAGVKHPVHGVLFKGGRLDGAKGPVTIAAKGPLLVETEIGYVIATDIGTKLRVPRQAMTTVEAIVPVIELATNPGVVKDGKVVITAPDAVASNVGSNQFIVGAAVAPKTIANVEALAVSLRRDDKVLHQATGADVAGGQAQNLMNVINQIIEQGRVLRRGDIILAGSLGGVKPGEKGKYAADFGALGKIEFVIE
jgi:2-keto-4-pentenoate hydratase/acetyl esterase/lipase